MSDSTNNLESKIIKNNLLDDNIDYIKEKFQKLSQYKDESDDNLTSIIDDSFCGFSRSSENLRSEKHIKIEIDGIDLWFSNPYSVPKIEPVTIEILNRSRISITVPYVIPGKRNWEDLPKETKVLESADQIGEYIDIMDGREYINVFLCAMGECECDYFDRFIEDFNLDLKGYAISETLIFRYRKIIPEEQLNFILTKDRTAYKNWKWSYTASIIEALEAEVKYSQTIGKRNKNLEDAPIIYGYSILDWNNPDRDQNK